MGWVTIKTYNFAHEAAIAQHLLEEEGVETHLMDELSIQMNPLYSTALGGVKLQVWAEDVEMAMQVLHAHNMLQNEDMQLNGLNAADSALEDDIEIPTDGELEQEVPIDTSKPISRGLIIGIAVGVIAAIAALSYFLQPSIQDRLIRQRWCVNYAIVGTETISPRTLGVPIKFNGTCEEGMLFDDKGNMYMPGFETQSSYGTYTLKNGTLNISLYDTALQMLNGSYAVRVDNKSLMLTSEKVVISSRASR